jgi:LCP family protein required for cell wall assembly
VVVAALTLAACTGETPDEGRSSAPPEPGVTVSGVPDQLADVVAALYAGDDVPATETAAEALAGRARSSPPPARPAQGPDGAVRGAQIGVVAAGDDVTLAVADPTADDGQWQVVGGWWPSLGVETPSVGATPRLVAVVGSDARPGEDVARSRADSLHLVGLDGTGAGGVVGIPRDSWVPLTTGGKGKINGELARGGPAALAAALERLSGLEPEGYLVTGFSGFVAMVDALGGVPFSLDRALQDPAAQLDLPAGERTLTGEEALAYARTRKSQPRGDIDRQLNGGAVLLAAAAAVRTAGPGALPALLEAADPHLVTDLTAEQLLTFAAATVRAAPERVPNVVLPARAGTVGNASVVLLEPGAADVWRDLSDGALTP